MSGIVKTYEGARAPFLGWRFTLKDAPVHGYILRHLERSEEWRQQRLHFAAENALFARQASAEALQEALATEWPVEWREERWLAEWLKAGLIREVRS